MKQFSPARLYEIWKKSGGSLLSLDVGKKKVGVAHFISSKKSMAPVDDMALLPKWILRRDVKGLAPNTESTVLIDELKNMITQFKVTAIVIGCPIDGYTGEPAQTATDYIYPFIANLRRSNEFCGMPYSLWDEKYTSAAVALLAEKQGKPHPRRISDAITASFAASTIGQDMVNTMEHKHCPGASIEAQTAWSIYLNNHNHGSTSNPQKPLCLSQFVELFPKDLILSKVALYHKVMVNYGFDEEEKIVAIVDEFKKQTPGLIAFEESDDVCRIDKHKVIGI